jgi:AraC-like DNA-binding protein
MQESLVASLGLSLWRLLEAKNLDAEAFLTRFGVDPQCLREPRMRIPFVSLCNAWAEVALVLDDPNVGLEMGSHYSPLDLQALGVTFLSSRDLTEALQRLKRYMAVFNSVVEIDVIEHADRIDFVSNAPLKDPAARGIMEDGRMAVVLDLARLGLNKNLDPIEAQFTHAEPVDIGAHYGVFRCPLTFSASNSRISFRLADARKPFTSANRELALGNDRILDELLGELGNSDLVTKVKKAIVENLPSGTPSEEDIAQCVFTSSRTLQRRLAEQDTSFRQLLLETRRELAERYIADVDMPLGEISYMLGFSDASSFSRAFKRWTGKPPATYRSDSTD